MNKINHYIDTVFEPQDQLLEEVLDSIKENGMPNISVSPSSGKFLTLLVSIANAKNILEIGALGGYSGICLARGFQEKGQLTSLELEEKYANLAKSNLTKAGFGDQVSYLTGPALESLETLAQENKRYDFFFIDADKGNYPNYLEACINIAEKNAVIAVDNVLVRGTVVDDTLEAKGHTDIMKEFNQLVADHPKLDAILVPIGDGITIARVK
ncbi:O-methyltransferase [Gracilibacillus massiliensis]|uniref:O-methyltransferase n=1 Tax=Gracilibacillus massiliensis TaxID=1564956 RepID=UPI00071C67D5|nr:O-methyltransferase [Gracilibacillus massiliensis]